MIYILENEIKDITNSMLKYKEDLRNRNTELDIGRGEMYILIDYGIKVKYDKYGTHDFESDDTDITDRYRIDYKYYHVNDDKAKDTIEYYHNTFEQIDYTDHIVMG